MLIGADGEIKSGGEGGVTVMGFEFGEDATVVAGGYHNGYITVVFRRGAHHGRATDVDVLNRILKRAVRPGHRRLKGVKVHDHQIDRCNAVV